MSANLSKQVNGKKVLPKLTLTLNEHYYTYASTLAEVYETFYNVICGMKMEGSLIKKNVLKYIV